MLVGRVRFPPVEASTAAGASVIEARELVKRFGEREALRGVNFEAGPGSLWL